MLPCHFLLINGHLKIKYASSDLYSIKLKANCEKKPKSYHNIVNSYPSTPFQYRIYPGGPHRDDSNLNGPNQPGGTLDRGVHVVVNFSYICSRSSFSTSKLSLVEKEDDQTFFISTQLPVHPLLHPTSTTTY